MDKIRKALGAEPRPEGDLTSREKEAEQDAVERKLRQQEATLRRLQTDLELMARTMSPAAAAPVVPTDPKQGERRC